MSKLNLLLLLLLILLLLLHSVHEYMIINLYIYLQIIHICFLSNDYGNGVITNRFVYCTYDLNVIDTVY